MSLDISMAIEREGDMMFGEAPVLDCDQQSILTMTMFDALNNLNTQSKARDLQEATTNKTETGEEALQAKKVTHHDEMENPSGAMNAAEAPATFPQAPHSPAVNHNAYWAGLFYEGEEEPIAEDQDYFTEQETSSTDQSASLVDHTLPFSKGIALNSLDHCMITKKDDENVVEKFLTDEDLEEAAKALDEAFEEVFKQYHEPDCVRQDVEEWSPLPKPPIRLGPYSPSTSPTGDVQNSMQQGDKPVHQVKQPIHQVEAHDQVEIPHQVEQTISQVEQKHQAQPLHAEEQTVCALDSDHQLKEPVLRAEQLVHQTRPAHPIKLPPGQLHLPINQSQTAYQIHQPGLYLSQNTPDLQQGTKNAWGMAKRAVRTSKTVTKSAPSTMFIAPQDINTSHVPQKVIADFQYYGEPEIMDGVLAHESNESPYIVPKEQSEHGLAGLIGLTLDQTKSGMRNKKARVRNTTIEKPKPTTIHSLLQYAGIRKSKFQKVKPASLPVNVQTEEEKTHLEPTVSHTEQQLIDKPHVITPVKKALPPFITEEQFLEFQKTALVKAQEKGQKIAKQVYCQELMEIVRMAQELACQSALYQKQTLQQRPFQAAIQPSDQQALFTSPEGTQLNPYYLQQQAPQTVQYQHAQQTAHYPQQQHVEQAIDYMSSMPGNHTASNLQQQAAQMTPDQSPMQGNQAPYDTPRVASTVPYYSVMPGSQASLYPSPQVTQMAPSNSPQRARQASSCIPPIQPSQIMSYQSLPTSQMSAFNIPQQAPQMGAYPSMQQTSQFAQQGHHVQPQTYYPQLQQSQQPDKYYTPFPTQQPIGFIPQYDSQNQAQVVAQQYRMQQNQMQRQHIQQLNMQYQQNLQDNLRNSAVMVAQARAQYTVEDFLPQDH